MSMPAVFRMGESVKVFLPRPPRGRQHRRHVLGQDGTNPDGTAPGTPMQLIEPFWRPWTPAPLVAMTQRISR